MTERRLQLTRRTVLAWLGRGAVAVAAARTGSARRVLAAEGDPESRRALVRIGHRYLEVVPDEAKVDALVKRLPGLSTAADVLARRDRFTQAVAADFEHGDTMLLDGWLLSRTELRAAALVALTEPAVESR